MPVCRGNKIPPSMAKVEPYVEFESPEDVLWTLVLTNPDGHLSDQTSEYVHWMIGNIQGNDCSTGEVLMDYMQPIPPKGTGFHRLVFILFEQSQKIDYKKYQKGPCHNLEERTFKMANFYKEHESHLVPKGLAFFQSQWDDSVRNAYHNILDMAEPVYEYLHRPPYHPPPKKYPHKQPFDRYFDRYRDKKDLAEEVLRLKLKMISPFKPNPKQETFPLIHNSTKYKPSWLKRREEIMHRRLEQYKDLP
jgi:large subunit ribosomal protein L38